MATVFDSSGAVAEWHYELNGDRLGPITLLLNVGLSMQDERNLKKAGHDTEKMGGAWLVPVYMFKRAQILKQNNAYFIVWVVLFCVSLFS